MTSDPFVEVANDFKTVCRQQPCCVSDGCLTVWWPWDRSCFSVSRSQLWCTCTDLTFWMVAGWTGSGSGGCCPWWYFWPSCDIGWCRCPGGQVVSPWWCVAVVDGAVAVAGGDTANTFQLCICKSLWGVKATSQIYSASTLSVWVDHFQFVREVNAEELSTFSTTVPSMWIGVWSLCCFLKSTIISIVLLTLIVRLLS